MTWSHREEDGRPRWGAAKSNGWKSHPKKEKEREEDRTVQVSPFSDYEESIITEADDDDDDDDEASCVCVFLFPYFWHSLIPPRGEAVSS